MVMAGAESKQAPLNGPGGWARARANRATHSTGSTYTPSRRQLFDAPFLVGLASLPIVFSAIVCSCVCWPAPILRPPGAC